VRTRIVATVGPATASREGVSSLIDAGANVIRINMAHGSHADHEKVVSWVRAHAGEQGRSVAILADLAGPKIRIGRLADEILLEEGALVSLAPEAVAGVSDIPTTYAALSSDVGAGDSILLDDGFLELRVDRVRDSRVICTVTRGGVLKSNKGINLPGVAVGAPALSDKDRVDLGFAIRAGVDYVGLSFVQRPEDIVELRSLIPEDGPLVLAKIEKDTALTFLDQIIAASDAVMVARGDLGVELPFEQVPLAQKRIIHLAKYYAKPVITATQMLDSMITNGRPTRAEVSDVWNAAADGSDAVMLSGETAMGKFPLLAVDAMGRILRELEGAPRNAVLPPEGDKPHYDGAATEHAVAHAAVDAARSIRASAIVCLTDSGFTARLVSSYRPQSPIVAVTYNRQTYQRLALAWGVQPVFCGQGSGYDSMVEAARSYLVATGLAEEGDRFVVTAGLRSGVRGATDMMRVESV
jgi:pyruvate kinase